MYTRVKYFTAAMLEAKSNETLPTKPLHMSTDSVEFITNMVNDELVELHEAVTIADQADALVDIIYYVMDTAARHGLPIDEIFDAVASANLSKIQNGKVLLSPEGKVLKPEGFTHPNIQAIIDNNF